MVKKQFKTYAAIGALGYLGYRLLHKPGPVLSLDTDQLRLHDGDPVLNWNGTPAVSGAQPVFRSIAANGFPAVEFDGIKDALAINVLLGSEMTLIMVATPATNADATLLSSLGGSKPWPGFVANSPASTNPLDWLNHDGVTADRYHLIPPASELVFPSFAVFSVVQQDGVLLEGRLNGITQFRTVPRLPISGKRLSYIGGRRENQLIFFAHFMLAGLRVYNRVLSDNDLSVEERQLGHKSGIAIA